MYFISLRDFSTESEVFFIESSSRFVVSIPKRKVDFKSKRQKKIENIVL